MLLPENFLGQVFPTFLVKRGVRRVSTSAARSNYYLFIHSQNEGPKPIAHFIYANNRIIVADKGTLKRKTELIKQKITN